ncbi:MAG: hypothetical protein K0S41_2995 [Anaerocolumna sp.]|jgi:hypothetical protein|nr:hypothetical protein [Anaerocolumna sp.]
MIKSIKNIQLFETIDDVTCDTYYGNDQEWFKTKWQRLSGCGPTVVSNITSYLNRSGMIDDGSNKQLMKSDSIKHMEEVWKYVTPSIQGIPTTTMLCKKANKYIKAKGLDLSLEVLDIPKSKDKRPDFNEIVSFIIKSLDDDIPIAFLNLHNGDEEMLDAWHWVTIIALAQVDGGETTVDILDEGKIKKIDLLKWFQTTNLGGGFVRFRKV